MTRPTLRNGDFGADVGVVQDCLGISTDLDFGGMTEAAVIDFQRANQIDVDGVVGDATWDALDEAFDLPTHPPPLYALDDDVLARICGIAIESDAASYSWLDRGVAPTGYVMGMAVAYAIAFARLLNGEPIADEAARAAGPDPDSDGLAAYRDDFAALGMPNDVDGVPTLRHVYVLLFGLGMRESSGRHCEGRDTTADNVAADTAEAGLFQMSWNASVCSTSMDSLFAAYDAGGDESNGYGAIFAEGVECSSSDWADYGGGDGARYQWLAKHLPLFACETAAIGLRSLARHWGPIVRHEAEVRVEVDAMLRAIESAIVPVPDPEPRLPRVVVSVDPPGSIRIIVKE